MRRPYHCLDYWPTQAEAFVLPPLRDVADLRLKNSTPVQSQTFKILILKGMITRAGRGQHQLTELGADVAHVARLVAAMDR